MFNLIKADLFRIKKDKNLIIALIIMGVFAIITPLVYAIMNNVGGEDLAELEQMGMNLSFNGKFMFTSAMSLTQNFGMILPLLAGILVCKEFGMGTIRNKIISGHTKRNVYISLLLSTMIFVVSLYVIYELIALIFGSIVLGYGTEINGKEILFVLKSLLAGILIYAAITALLVFISTLTRSIGLTIVLQIVSVLILTLIGSVYSFPGMPEAVETVTKAIPTYQIARICSYDADTALFITSYISSVLYIIILSLSGILFFNRADQK